MVCFEGEKVGGGFDVGVECVEWLFDVLGFVGVVEVVEVEEVLVGGEMVFGEGVLLGLEDGVEGDVMVELVFELEVGVGDFFFEVGVGIVGVEICEWVVGVDYFC